MQRIDALVEKARSRARFRIAALRLEYPGQDEVALGRRLVASMALRAGLAGAVTGTLSLVALPLGLPAGVAISLLLEAELIFALLELYGVDTGTLSVNSHSSVRYWTPFGGMKQSGLGRELGPDALSAFTDVKNVFISTEG